MQKILFTAFIFSLATTILAQPTAQLIAFYPFSTPSFYVSPIGDTLLIAEPIDENNANGNGSNGQPGTIPPPLSVCGVRDAAARFDGKDDSYLFIGPVNDVFTLGDFTISFYMKPLPQAGTQVIMAKQDSCNKRQHTFIIRYNYQSNKLTATISETDSLQSVVSAKLDPERCWQHILLTKRNQRFELFVNGTSRDGDIAAKRLDLTNPATLFTISRPICQQSDKHFKGDLDELRIYNRALSLEEIDETWLRPDMIGNRDTLIYLGNSVQIFTTQTCAVNYSWQPTGGVSDPAIANPIITPDLSSTYKIGFIHPECVAYDTIHIRVIDPDTLDCSKIFIPNAFTPDGNGRNETWGISNPFAVPDLETLEVFDRWGGRIFLTDTSYGQWDGTFGGKEVNPGIYLWRLHYRCKGEEKVRSGSLTLIR